MSKYVLVSEDEYINYMLSSNRSNKIRIFWKEIYRSMPEPLRNECKSKCTKLYLKESYIYQGLNVSSFVFKALDCSVVLNNFLCRFTVWVKQDEQSLDLLPMNSSIALYKSFREFKQSHLSNVSVR